LQAFHVDVANVDQDVAMAIHICFKCMFLMFHLFQAYVASVLSRCCKSRSGCWIYMQVFQVFSYVCLQTFSSICCKFYNGYTHAFKFFLVFHKCFRRMLQVF
jgi:hypothetical protein